MNNSKIIFIVLLSFSLNNVIAQKTEGCMYCKMEIKDQLHSARATTNNKAINFDAIECLINYFKNNSSSNSSLKVADYSTGELIAAQSATYLKSKAIPSPMGANLSAFKKKVDAHKKRDEMGGELYTWDEISKKFNDSSFRATDHSHHNHNRADAYAPSGIMGDHLHPKGDFMVSLKHMYMSMDGNLKGNSSVSNEEIFEQYMVAPQKMSMQMYMLGVMYAPSDNITLMVMQNLVKKDMDLKAMMMNMNMVMINDFSTSSSGLGDLKVGALFNLYSKGNSFIHINTLFNIPVGSINNTNDTPMMKKAKLPYSMQLGSGTVDATLGFTYKGNTESWSWGIQQLNTFRIGKNNEDYRLGNGHELNSWLAYSISNSFSTSIRLSGSTHGKIKGEDTDLNPMMVPTANTNNYGGEMVESAVGFNFLVPNTKFLLSIEAGIPIYQNYNGVFMDQGFNLKSSIKYSVL